MNKKQIIVVAVVSAAFAVCAVAVTAGSVTAYSPLYVVRMQQQSSEMNFSPTKMSEFTYNTEHGFTVNCYAADHCSADLLFTAPGETFCATCFPECSTSKYTCQGKITCCITCFFQSCLGTCYTCPGQGYTCDETSCQDTCEGTCDEPTCPSTCWETCPNTCWETCDDLTCFNTCERTCRYTCTKPCQP